MISFLLVTCCLEPSRQTVLEQVVENIKTKAPELLDVITVFDNASTQPDTLKLLTNNFSNVYVGTPNLGYWSAINWWLEHISTQQPEFTYVIESDMLHYDFDRIWTCANFLKDNPDVGACRLHEYSITNKHLYDKDRPVPGSRKTIWQSHTNKVTGKPITTVETDTPGIFRTNFLTQLPALNRYLSMTKVFQRLLELGSFTEFDFQRMYHVEHPTNIILDGGIFNCDPGGFGEKVLTGSWTSQEDLNRIGYKNTRFATISPADQYNVIKVGKI